MPVLPLLYAWVAPTAVWFLRIFIVSVVVRIIVAFGVGIATYVGFNFLIDEATAIISNAFGALPPEVSGFVGLLNLDTAASMILGALAFRAIITAAQSLRLIRLAG